MKRTASSMASLTAVAFLVAQPLIPLAPPIAACLIVAAGLLILFPRGLTRPV
jgi:hypothetical protein